MTMRTCRPERLLRFAFGDPAEEERATTANHVATCVDCQSDLRTVLSIAEGVDVSEYVAPTHGAGHGDAVEKIRAAAIEAESRARESRDLLLGLPARERFAATIRSGESMISAALGWLLLDAAETHIFTEPREALQIYDLTTYIADAATLASELRVETWKNYAWLLAYLGEYARAEDAIFWAEDNAEQCVDRRHMLAIVHLTRGIILSQMERWREALPIVTATRKDFRELGDVDREVKASEQEANILMRLGDVGGAVAILSKVVELPADDLTRARRYGNIAHALELVGAYWSATEFLARSSEIHARVGAMLMVYRDTWEMARILAQTERLDEAGEKFSVASDGFRSLDAVDSAIRVDLDRSEFELEKRIANDATYDRLRAVATYAVEKGLPIAQCRALAYLRDLGRTAKLPHVRHVRSFILRHATHPNIEFRQPG